MSIWRTTATIEELQERARNTLLEQLGMRFTEIGPDYLRVTMPVDARTRQPMGVLHGGASVALAETVGSTAANLCVDAQREMCLGQEINANHLRPVSTGHVTATARPLHRGARSHVWQVEIRDERERLVCISRLTMAVVALAILSGCGQKGPLYLPDKHATVVAKPANPPAPDQVKDKKDDSQQPAE